MKAHCRMTWVWLDRELNKGFDVDSELFDRLLELQGGVDELCDVVWLESAALENEELAAENGSFENSHSGRFYFPVTDEELVIERDPDRGVYHVHVAV